MAAALHFSGQPEADALLAAEPLALLAYQAAKRTHKAALRAGRAGA